LDLLDRTLIISTKTYTSNEIEKILDIRIEEEDVQFSDKAKLLLTKIASDISLRYAMQLISTGDLVAKKRKATKVEPEDLKKKFITFLLM